MRNFTVGLRNAIAGNSVKVLELIPPVTDTAMVSGRAEKKMSVNELVVKIIPQLRKERRIIAVPQIRVFLWIAFLFPALTNKILFK